MVVQKKNNDLIQYLTRNIDWDQYQQLLERHVSNIKMHNKKLISLQRALHDNIKLKKNVRVDLRSNQINRTIINKQICYCETTMISIKNEYIKQNGAGLELFDKEYVELKTQYEASKEELSFIDNQIRVLTELKADYHKRYTLLIDTVKSVKNTIRIVSRQINNLITLEKVSDYQNVAAIQMKYKEILEVSVIRLNIRRKTAIQMKKTMYVKHQNQGTSLGEDVWFEKVGQNQHRPTGESKNTILNNELNKFFN